MDRKKFDKKKFPFCDKGHNYAIDIVEGKIVASKYVKGACLRYLNDLENKKANFYFNADSAEKFLRLAQKFDHVIGQWDTPNIVFEPWQCWVWMTIMGFINKDTKFRRFRMAHLEVARGNAKSAMASQAGLYFLALDEPNGNQISTVATKKEQARIVLDSSRNMAKKSQSFLQGTGVKVLAHSITHPPSNSMMRALSSEHSGLDGLNDVLAICDELHAMRAEVFDVITSGMSKRKDSLTLCITTAGFDEDSVGYSQSIYAKKVATGEVQDDQFFSVVYTLDDGDDWADESVWIKANPNLGVSVDPVTLKAKVEKAIITPRDIKNVKVKHMNLWISEANAFYDQKKWDACANPAIKMENFLHLPCRLGIDLASHIDITSIATVFRDRKDKEEKYYIFDRSYIPEGTVKEVRSPLYEDCISKGFLIQTKGEAINYDFIEEEARDIAKRFKVQECLYDTWNATAMAQKLSGNIEMVKIAMNVANFSEPMKKLDALIRQGKVVHNGSPLLRWCLGNVVAKEDHNGNVYPRKSHVRLKIDPIVAILMALAGWLQDESKESIYEERGVLTI